MELHATGFNAWHQLDFSNATKDDEPLDLFSFRKVLHGNRIEHPSASLCCTLVRVDQRIIQAGIPADGDDLGWRYSSVETAGGLVYTTQSRPSAGAVTELEPPKQGLWQYSTTPGQTKDEARLYQTDSPVRRMAAFDVGVVMLHRDGSVTTMGDPRFENCLGREVTDESPADRPGRVTDLDGLGEAVKTVAAGGYTVVALTEGGSLYAWGTRTVGTHRRGQAFEPLTGVPNYIEVDGGKDIQDVAVGESHALVLTTDGCVYGIGHNENGQLGLGDADHTLVEDWVKMDFNAPADQRIVGVAAGPRCSFIITDKNLNDQRN